MDEKPLKLEILVNSPGPHDEVRIRQPFQELQKKGVDCRIHERPFRFNDCIRPHSLVLWQRPMPDSWQDHMEHLQWLRERGCLLLTEWDDHPDLFNEKIRRGMKRIKMAQLVGCHAIHTSSAALATAMREWNPLSFVIENGIKNIQSLDLRKHNNSTTTVFIGNQNREIEHQSLAKELKKWGKEDSNIKIIIVSDKNLVYSIGESISYEYYETLSYANYRALLSRCQIALLPLNKGTAQRCKTVIKWAEASAESVAVVAGPELYNNIEFDRMGNKLATLANSGEEIIKKARELKGRKEVRKSQVKNAYDSVKRNWNLEGFVKERKALYEALWRKRVEIDNQLVERLKHKVKLLNQNKLLQ